MNNHIISEISDHCNDIWIVVRNALNINYVLLLASIFIEGNMSKCYYDSAHGIIQNEKT